MRCGCGKRFCVGLSPEHIDREAYVKVASNSGEVVAMMAQYGIVDKKVEVRLIEVGHKTSLTPSSLGLSAPRTSVGHGPPRLQVLPLAGA